MPQQTNKRRDGPYLIASFSFETAKSGSKLRINFKRKQIFVPPLLSA
jgi:hypothetical protein